MAKLVGELGINHNGDPEQAFKIVEAFDFLDAIKIQKMCPVDFLPVEKQDKPHPVKKNAFGKTYLEHREKLELDISFYKELEAFVKGRGQIFGASVCDIVSAAQVIKELKPDYIKIPSCLCNNFELINFVRSKYSGPLHISLGMTDYKERFAVKDRIKPAVYYTTTSCYDTKGPVYLDDTAVSIHQPDPIYGQIAIGAGAKWVEYHITLDQSAKGSDHHISLRPREYEYLAKWQKKNAAALKRIQFGRPREIPGHEMPARKKLWKAVRRPV